MDIIVYILFTMKLRSGLSATSERYYNPKVVGSFSGATKFKLPKKSRQGVQSYLTTQPTYTLHKPIRKRFTRRRVICWGPYTNLEADLVFMTQFARYNKGVKYLLVITCCFTKFAYIRFLKNKTSKACITALASVLKDIKSKGFKVKKISVDEGGEFISHLMDSFLRCQNIILFSSFNKAIKSSIVERLNKTIQGRIYRFMTFYKTKEYISVVQDLVNSYNSTIHRSTQMAPNQITHRNSELVWNNLYILNRKERVKNSFNIFDKVRIPLKSTLFTKGYVQRWTTDIFVITNILNTTPFTYELTDKNGELLCKKYYGSELSLVTL